MHPLDIVAQGDAGAFPYSTTIDGDGDGYSNADEIDNGTAPCSAADHLHDWDGDKLCDLNDSDDDNDGLPDTSDPFAIDPANGQSTSLPTTYSFDNNTTSPGGLLDLGLTGLITNGVTNYRELYDPQKLTAGGAPEFSRSTRCRPVTRPPTTRNTASRC